MHLDLVGKGVGVKAEKSFCMLLRPEKSEHLKYRTHSIYARMQANLPQYERLALNLLSSAKSLA
jgi:hypothetical protein